MPKIDAPEKIFFSLLGKEMSDEELCLLAQEQADGFALEFLPAILPASSPAR